MPNPLRCSVTMRTITQAAGMCLALPGVDNATITVDGQHLIIRATASSNPRHEVTIRMPTTQRCEPFAVAVAPQSLATVAASRRTIVNPVIWDADTNTLTVGNMPIPATATSESTPQAPHLRVCNVSAAPTAAWLAASAHHVAGDAHTLMRIAGPTLRLATTNPHTALFGQVSASPAAAGAASGPPDVLCRAPGLLGVGGTWQIGLASDAVTDHVHISDGTVAITTSAPHAVTDPHIPELDAPESGTVWDADIRDSDALIKFLETLPAHFTEDRGYVQLRNPLGAAGGDDHQLEVTARDGNHLAVSGRRVGNHVTRPVITSSVDEIAVDVPLHPLRVLARSAGALGGPLVLRGHRPYVSTSLISAHTPHGTAVAVARTPQPL